MTNVSTAQAGGDDTLSALVDHAEACIAVTRAAERMALSADEALATLDARAAGSGYTVDEVFAKLAERH